MLQTLPDDLIHGAVKDCNLVGIALECFEGHKVPDFDLVSNCKSCPTLIRCKSSSLSLTIHEHRCWSSAQWSWGRCQRTASSLQAFRNLQQFQARWQNDLGKMVWTNIIMNVTHHHRPFPRPLAGDAFYSYVGALFSHATKQSNWDIVKVYVLLNTQPDFNPHITHLAARVILSGQI
jgi:hypothetical protein